VDASNKKANGSAGQLHKSLPLTGLKVLDLTQFLSGPYCTQILADLGAEVTKVEAPQGDLARHIPPHFVGQDSVYYLSVNRNKKSVVIDSRRPEGQALLRRLALQHDVIVENFRPGVMRRLGLSYEDLSQSRSGMIWCSISGFGQSGPYRDKPAYDMIVQALSGGMSLTGERGGTAVRAGIPIGDIAAGMYATIGVLAALNRRNETGKGDIVDVSMLDCQVAMLSYQAAYHLFSGEVPGRQGSSHDSIPTYRTFRAKDGIDVVITANTERMWKGMCNAIGQPALAEEPRFASGGERYRNRHELWEILDAAFATRPADEWVPLLEREEVPVGVVNTLDRVVRDPQVEHRGMVSELSNASGQKVRVIGNPIFLGGASDIEQKFPPTLGQDTAEVLSDLLGLSEVEIATAVKAGTIHVYDEPKAD
jgi:crotonobetainyl-CoA:carnitine CoA-transferase CaiB-like acyl-CoA transferase